MRLTTSICLAPLFALLLLTSCDKDDKEERATTETVDAMLVWSDPATDGCGFTLLIGQEEYKPI